MKKRDKEKEAIAFRLNEAYEHYIDSDESFYTRTGVDVEHLDACRRGDRLPDSITLKSLHESGVNVNWILSGAGPETVPERDRLPDSFSDVTETMRKIAGNLSEFVLYLREDVRLAALPGGRGAGETVRSNSAYGRVLETQLETVHHFIGMPHKTVGVIGMYLTMLAIATSDLPKTFRSLAADLNDAVRDRAKLRKELAGHQARLQAYMRFCESRGLNPESDPEFVETMKPVNSFIQNGGLL